MASLAILRGTQINPCENRLLIGDAEELPFKDCSFDYILSFDVFEHIPHPEKCISEIARVLKKNGRTLIYAVSKKDKYTLHWIERKISFNRWGVDTVGGHNWENFLYADDVVKEMEYNGLEVEKVIYFHSLFTLVYDENIPKLFSVLKKIIKCLKWITHHVLNISMSETQKSNKIQQQRTNAEDIEHLPNYTRNFFKNLYLSSARSIILPLLELVDKINSSRGYSNGFYVLAKKRQVTTTKESETASGI